MKELQELRDEILTLRNYGVINKEEELSLLSKLNSVKEQLILSGVVKSFTAEEVGDMLANKFTTIEEAIAFFDSKK